MTEYGMMRMTRMASALLTLVFVSLLSVRGSAAAQTTDSRWLAWMGCWQPVPEVTTADAPDALRCIRPLAGDVGVELVSIEGGEISARQTIRADGLRHEASLEGCTGWDRADFSTDPARVFLTSEYVCEGDVARASTGLLAIVSPEEWVEVEVVRVDGGEPMTWVTRYRSATQSQAEAAGFGDLAAGQRMAVRSARIAAARLSVDDVIEASRYVEAEGVGAWIAEHDAPFEIDADELVRMADAGVPEQVIDMMIAVTYPSRFAVDRESEQDTEGYRRGVRGLYGGWGAYRGWGYYQPFYGSLFFSPFGYYSRYGYGYGWGGYGYRGYYVPVVIDVERPDTGGRVINRRGYRQGSSAATTGRRGATPRGYVGGSSRGWAGSSSSRRPPSSGTSTGRTAKRRGGGG